MKRLRTLLFLFLLACHLLACDRTAESGQFWSPAPVPTAGTNPFHTIEVTPRYDRSLGFYDMIAPIYEPDFLPAAAAQLDGKQLVIGVAWGGEAKAYPVCVLRFHELVNDTLAGVPILVSW